MKRIKVIQITPVLTTSPYSTGDALGVPIALEDYADFLTQGARIETVTITDGANQKAAIDLLICNQVPTGATVTDNAAIAMGAQLPNIVARIPVAVGDYVTLGSTQAVATIRNVGAVVKAAPSGQLYAVLQVQGTPTYAANSLQVRIAVEI